MGEFLLMLGGILWGVGLLVFYMEAQRLPGQYLRWTVYQRGVDNSYSHGEGGISVGVRQRSKYVQTGFVKAGSASFDEELHAAIADARERAITLNASGKSALRKLP